MFWALILLAQAAPQQIGPAGAAGFDLRNVPSGNGAECGAQADGEIVVCGRRGSPDHQHYLSMEALFREKPVRAEAGLGGGASARVHGDTAIFPNGQTSKRALITITKPF